MEFYAGANEGGVVRKFSGVDAISCGRNYAIFNSAMLSSPVGGEGVLSARIAIPSIFFRALGVGWSYWVCHDLLDGTSLSELRETCRAYGMEQVLTAPGMWAPSFASAIRRAPPIDVREVTDASGRLTFCHLVSTIFDLPFQMTMNVYGNAASWREGYYAFIGYVRDHPLSIAMLNVNGGCCGFYSVGTLPGYRRKGYAEAVMREAYARVRERLECDGLVLQSSAAGRRLYDQMGFREVTRFSVFRSVPGLMSREEDKQYGNDR
jgi:ribosomal protein S18 acetylase RimI-like enzyme